MEFYFCQGIKTKHIKNVIEIVFDLVKIKDIA